MRADSVSAVGVDIRYVENTEGGQNPFDILSNAGILSHGLNYSIRRCLQLFFGEQTIVSSQIMYI